MARLPIMPNTICDVYHTGSPGPPAAPDIVGVPIYMVGNFPNIKPPGSSTSPFGTFSHTAYFPATVDIRDPTAAAGTGPDTIYVPDKTGVMYTIVWIERMGRGTSLDMFRVHLTRSVYTAPNNNL
jgi:hypothetical protein